MLRDAGFDGVEVPIFDISPESVSGYEKLGQRLSDLGLETLGVGARSGDDSPDQCGPRRSDVASARPTPPSTSARSSEQRRSAGRCGAPLGYITGAGPTPDERKRSVESLRAPAEHAQTRDVTIVVEYLNRFEMYLINCAADAAALVREVDHPNCRLMYDTFHAHIEEKDPRTAPAGARDVLGHFHASENDRGTPGPGRSAWDQTFSALHEIGYDSWIVIEAFGDALPDLAAATRIWRRMFDSEEQLARDGAAFIRARWSRVAA